MMSFAEFILFVDIVALLAIYFSLIVLIAFPRKKITRDYDLPVSIIIPAHNEEKNIEQTLRSITLTNYKNKKEIILINDGSIDNTENLTKKFAKENNQKITIINTNHVGKAKAILKATKFSNYSILVIIDADTEIQKNLLTKLIQPFSNKKIAATSSTILVKPSRKILSWFQDFEYAISSCYRSLLDNINATCVIPSFCAIRKSALLQIEDFSGDTLGEDLDMCMYFKKAGYEIRMVPESIAFTSVPENLKSIIAQRIRWYRGSLQVIFKHKEFFYTTKHLGIGYYFMPMQLFWFFHSLIFIPSILYLIFNGVWEGFGSQHNYFSFEAIVFFLEELTTIRDLNIIHSNLNYPLTMYNTCVLMVFTLSYAFGIYSIIKFSKNKKVAAFAIMFFFPYLILQLSLYVISIMYQIKNKSTEGTWEKLAN